MHFLHNVRAFWSAGANFWKAVALLLPEAWGNVASTLTTLIDTLEISHEIIELTDGDAPVQVDALMSLQR